MIRFAPLVLVGIAAFAIGNILSAPVGRNAVIIGENDGRGEESTPVQASLQQTDPSGPHLGGNVDPWPAVRAGVKDGDTLVIELRIHGIDAPESWQQCRTEHGASAQTFDCGDLATQRLAEFIDDTRLECTFVGDGGYGRLAVRCLRDGQDLGEWMVANGYALASRDYSLEYVDEEDAARAAGTGFTFTNLQAPAIVRENRRQPNLALLVPPDPDCPIKGNSSGIYHMPGDRDYDVTTIDPSRADEAWFCSAAEAEAAGWRAARR